MRNEDLYVFKITCIGFDFVKPLTLLLSVLPLPAPSVNPFLFLLVPYLLILLLLLNTLRYGEFLPFCRQFWFW